MGRKGGARGGGLELVGLGFVRLWARRGVCCVSSGESHGIGLGMNGPDQADNLIRERLFGVL